MFFLPERIWERGGEWMIRFYEQLKKVKKKMEEKSGFQKENLPIFGEEYKGQALLGIFPEMEAKLALGIKTITFLLPQYKFYTALLFKLLESHRRLGVSLKLILPELRINLIKDLQFEKKLMGNIIGGNLQFFVITATTWSFILLSSTLADLPLDPFVLLIIFIVQIMAFIVFNACFCAFKKRIFLSFDEAIEKLYLFVSLAEIGLPINQVLEESKMLEGKFMTNKSFQSFAGRLTGLVGRWKESGFSPKVETGEIIREIWHSKEVSFERFLKHLDLLKFVILAFFFLPAYFFYLYSIFQFFMEQ
jgi:hypothetical protein